MSVWIALVAGLLVGGSVLDRALRMEGRLLGWCAAAAVVVTGVEIVRPLGVW